MNFSTCIQEISKCLKSIVNNSVTEYDEEKWNERKNTIALNVTSTASINCHSKKVREPYILHAVLLVIMLLLIIYYCLMLSCKTKTCNKRWKIINFKKFVLKIVRVIISMT